MASASLATVVNRILDDLFVTGDYTAQAQTALAAAIRHYDSHPWWFTEERATSTTVASQEYYALPDDYGYDYSITVEVTGITYPLIKRSHEELELWQTKAGDYTGAPRDYAIYDGQLRLFPVPDDAYTLTLSYHITEDGSAWYNVAEELVRRRAEFDVAANTLRDGDAANAAKAQEQDELRALKRKNILKVTTGHTRRGS